MRYKFLIITLFIVVSVPSSRAVRKKLVFKQDNEVIFSRTDKDFYDISDAMKYLEDSSGKISFDQIASGLFDTAFRASIKERKPFQSQEGVFWAKLKIYADNANTNWYFVVHPTGDWSMDSVIFYSPVGIGRYSISISGYDVPLDQREVYTAATIFPINMLKGPQTLYLRYKKGKWMDITTKMPFRIQRS